MSLKFARLTRAAVRKLKPSEKITEHGVVAPRLDDGDIRFSVAVMANRQRVQRVVGLESDGTTRTQAEDFIASVKKAAKEERLSEILPKGRKVHLSFAGAADLYLSMLRESDGKDYQNNEQHLRLHVVPYFGSMRLEKITRFTIEKYKRHCAEKGIAEGTINRTLATFRRMGRLLAAEGVTPQPFPTVKIPRERTRRTFVLSPTEETALLEAALQDSSSYVWLFVKLALATSLRHSEMLGARFEHFDSHRRRLRVRVKGGKWRDQPLTRGITIILDRERKMAADPEGWIFPNPGSATGHTDRMVKAFRRCVVRANLDPPVVTPHILRHTAITRLVAAGADVKTVQEFSGHESIEMVMRYTHRQDRAIDRALDRMEDETVVEHPGARKPANS